MIKNTDLQLSNEELVELYQRGDNNALEEILERNKGIIYKLSRKFYIGGINSVEIEDLIQEGKIGLIIAAQKYDLNNEKKAAFITYACHWIYQRMSRYIRKNDTNEEMSLNSPINNSENECELGDMLADKHDTFEDIDKKLDNELLRQRLDESMKCISLIERNILHLMYGLDCNKCTYREAAEIIGTYYERVRQLEHKALKRLRMSPKLKIYEPYCNKIKSEKIMVDNIKSLDRGYINKYNWGF